MSDDSPETTRDQLRTYFETQGIPAAIYNVAGANRGVVQALKEASSLDATIFVGHELTPVSQGLLEAGTMDYVISHDFAAEVRAAVHWIEEYLSGVEGAPKPSPILVHTRYNCSL